MREHYWPETSSRTDSCPLAEAARYLPVSESKLRSMARTGHMPEARLTAMGWRIDFPGIIAAHQRICDQPKEAHHGV